MKLLTIIILLTCFFRLSLAQVPGTLSYQGILMQSDGITPIADGAHSIVFNLYTTSSGGAALFGRTISVTTTKGLYTCIIGGGTAPNAPFNATEMNQVGSQQIFIGITVDGGSELSPRAQLTTSPYAVRSESVTNTANPTGGNISFWGANNTLSSDAGMFWDSNNKYLGIGTSTPAGFLDIKGSQGNLRCFDYLLQFTRPATNYIHATSVGGQFYFTVNGNVDTNPSLMIKANGSVGVGTTSPLERLHVVGNIFATGTITPSDSRLKENISDLKYGLNEVLKFRPVSYTWKSEPNGKKQLGLIAQETLVIVPEIIKLPQDESEFYALNYVQLIPVLIKATQEQQTQIEVLKTTNKDLEQRLQGIEALLKKYSISNSLQATQTVKP